MTEAPLPHYPRGLVQPQGAYRFGLEALLLAAFAAQILRERRSAKRECAVAELGSGCGAALLGVALHSPAAVCLGLEREAALVAAARANAGALGLSGRVRFLVADVAAPLPQDAGPHDMALANPPWGLGGSGRPSPSGMREQALRAESTPGGDAFPIFCAAAQRLLRHKGAFCCIVPASALTRICAALEGARLGLRRVLPLRPHSGDAATRLLLLAQKGARAEPVLCSPLTLHCRGATSGSSWTRAALSFCPWLAQDPAASGPQPHGDAS
ncbi:MAG: N-6 DNA methylase [Desulfovibrio sp.]|uniref:methyltransferase n=1 Tax=Desulfovibrio sp. TaxID=885 RepID=UPI001A6E29D1|nr:methyltransferase [Desulfovibrio sp.]MBD5416887.1 N-6 DNA methylase [Desulfovibrio sp.]